MTAPLLRVSEYKSYSNIQTASADARLRDLIRQASEMLTAEANMRRFDRRIETRYFTPYTFENGGDLTSTYELALDADLVSITTLTNGDGTAISSGYRLLPRNSDNKTSIRLNPNGTTTWNTPTSDDPYESVSVFGVWGYGGEWVSSGSVVKDDPLSASATTIDVGDGGADNHEIDQVIKIDSEYMIVTAVTDNTSPTADTITVTRAYNGSTAASHVLNSTIYYYLSHPTVRRAITRICNWYEEQAKSPMYGTVNVADVSIPVNLESLPNDAVRIAKQLAWPMRIVGA